MYDVHCSAKLNAVTDYLESRHLLPSGFARQCKPLVPELNEDFWMHLTLVSIQRFISFLESCLRNWVRPCWHFWAFYKKTKIFTKHHTFANILKTKNGRVMKSVSINMFSWSVDTMNIKLTLSHLLQSHNMQISAVKEWNKHQTNFLILRTEQ